MTDSRERMLGRIQAALAGAREAGVAERSYRHTSDEDSAAIQAEFIAKVRDYRAQVQVDLAETELAPVVAAICREHEIRHLLVPDDLPAHWLPEASTDIVIVRDTPPLANDTLDQCDGVLTGCALAIAQTGTLVLDGSVGQGRRALSLVPDLHICVVRSSQIVGLVPEAISQLARNPRRPITFISGPSATSDIELSRVEGVHGPRTLVVLVVADFRTNLVQQE
jgi:L-lactate dehydrogenase complex protein LldG